MTEKKILVVGELHQDLFYKNNAYSELADEIADVFAWLCSVANLLEIDVSGAFYEKYSDVCSKCNNSPCDCPADH